MAIKYAGKQLIGYGKAQVFDTSKLAEGAWKAGEVLSNKRKEKKKAKAEFTKNLTDIDVSKIRRVDTDYITRNVNAVSEYFHKNSAAILNPKLDGGKASMEVQRLKGFAVGEVQKSIGVKEEDKLLDDKIAADGEHYGTSENYDLSKLRRTNSIENSIWEDAETADVITTTPLSMTDEEKADFYSKSKSEQNEMIVGNFMEKFNELDTPSTLSYEEKFDKFMTDLGYSEEEMESFDVSDLKDKNSDAYKRLISGQRTEIQEGEKEITTTGTGFRANENIDSKIVDKFNLGANGEILKDGKAITGAVPNMLGLANITGVRAEGNKIFADIKAKGPFKKFGGASELGEFKKDGDSYKWVGGENYDKIPEKDKKEMDAFISAIESDPEFAKQVLGSVQSGTEFNTSEYGYEESEEVGESTTKTTTLDDNLLENAENYEEYVNNGGRLNQEQFNSFKSSFSEYETKWDASQGTFSTTTEKGTKTIGLHNRDLNANPALGKHILEVAEKIVPKDVVVEQSPGKFTIGEGGLTVFHTRKEADRQSIIDGMNASIVGHRYETEMEKELDAELLERQKQFPEFTRDDLLLEKALPFVKYENKVDLVRDIFKPKGARITMGGETKIEDVGTPLPAVEYSMQLPTGANVNDVMAYTTQNQGVAVQITKSTTGEATFNITTTASGYRSVAGKTVNNQYVPPSFRTGRKTFATFRPTKVETYFTATKDIPFNGHIFKKGDIVPDDAAKAHANDIKKAHWLMGWDGTEEQMIRLDDDSKAVLAQWMLTRTKSLPAVKEAFKKGGIVYDFSKLPPQ